ncbi:hypothetical protein CIB48_g7022 [Xylaria polymorpha]|nr:hypothetical protein CIB48_g7022 [Xylaria polymorpha]
MNNYYGGSYFYGGDEFYVPGHQSSSEWSASSSAGTPMTREPSGESAISTYSSELVRSPNSEYGPYESSWPPVAVGNQEPPWSPTMSDSGHENTSSPISYNPPCMRDYTIGDGNDYSTREQDRWWRDYGFITDLEPGQEPFWQLRPGLEPTDERPATRAHEDMSAKE